MLRLDGAPNPEAYEAAKERNDFSLIVGLLRDPDEPLDWMELRELIAQKIEGSFRAKKGAKKQDDVGTKVTKIEAYKYYLWLTLSENCGPNRAKEEVAEILSVDKGTVSNWFKDLPSGAEAYRSLYRYAKEGGIPIHEPPRPKDFRELKGEK